MPTRCRAISNDDAAGDSVLRNSSALRRGRCCCWRHREAAMRVQRPMWLRARRAGRVPTGVGAAKRTACCCCCCCCGVAVAAGAAAAFCCRARTAAGLDVRNVNNARSSCCPPPVSHTSNNINMQSSEQCEAHTCRDSDAGDCSGGARSSVTEQRPQRTRQPLGRG